jgi:hypothetical protein
MRPKQSHEVVTACQLVSIIFVWHNRDFKRRHALAPEILPSSGLLAAQPEGQGLFIQGACWVQLAGMVQMAPHHRPGVTPSYTGFRGDFVE